MIRPVLSLILIGCTSFALAQQSGLYSVINTAQVGGDGGFDYVYADEAGRRLYVPRTGQGGHIAVYDLDTLSPAGDIANVSAHGAAVSAKSAHGFASSSPVAMWDTKTLKLIKTIDVQGKPDGILYDDFNDRVWVFSHAAPHATIIDAGSGNIIGTLDLGGAPEQAVTDSVGHIYVSIEDKDNIAVVDARKLAVTTHFGLDGKGGSCNGLALDTTNHVLFAACHSPQNMVMLSATSGKVLAALPIGSGCDGAQFNPNTMEAFSSEGAGTLSVIKEQSPTSFVLEQTVQTMTGAKTLTLDRKTNRVLLIAAEFGPVPATTDGMGAESGMGGGRARGPLIPDSFSILAVGK